MSSQKTLLSLSDEHLSNVCRFLAPLPDPLKATYPEKDSGYWRVVARRLFSAHTRFPVASSLLSLRSVSKRLNKVASPYAWERLDLKISKEASSKGQGSRNSFLVLDFISSRADIAAYVKVLSLDVEDYLANEEEYTPEVGGPIEKLVRSLTSLEAFNLCSAPHLSPEGVKVLLSKPTLRLLQISGQYGDESQELQFDAGEVDLSHLRAYCTNRFHGLDNIMGAAPNLKHVVLHHHQDLFSSGEDDMYGSVEVAYPWLKTVEQLEIADSSGDATVGIAESFASANADRSDVPLKELRIQVPWGEEPVSLQETSPGELALQYASADLRILSFYEVPELISEDLKSFVSSFPNLEELGYCGDTLDVDSFDEFVPILENLKKLRVLEWSVAKAKKGAIPEDAGLSELCAKLPMLQKVIVTTEFDREKVNNYFYTIERDENGAYKGASVEVLKNLQSPITSWEVSRTPYLL